MNITHQQFGTIRIAERNGQYWFCAKDVCDALTIINYRDAVSVLDDDEKGVGDSDTLGGRQKMLMVSESGLYALILRSNKPQARAFRKWVTSEVLPSLRRTGSYGMANDYGAAEERYMVPANDDPVQWVGNVLAVKLRYLLDQGVMTHSLYIKQLSRGKLQRLNRPGPKTPVWMAVGSMQPAYRHSLAMALMATSPHLVAMQNGNMYITAPHGNANIQLPS